jgi:hypothetical protein
MEHPAGPVEVEASIEIATHERIRLVRDPAGWRIGTDVVDDYGQSTPYQALRSFVRAVERRRWDIVLRLIFETNREGVTEETHRERWEGEGREEIERVAAGIRAALEAGTPIEIVGGDAVMPWGGRFRAQLVREGGVWRIRDPDEIDRRSGRGRHAFGGGSRRAVRADPQGRDDGAHGKALGYVPFPRPRCASAAALERKPRGTLAEQARHAIAGRCKGEEERRSRLSSLLLAPRAPADRPDRVQRFSADPMSRSP